MLYSGEKKIYSSKFFRKMSDITIVTCQLLENDRDEDFKKNKK